MASTRKKEVWKEKILRNYKRLVHDTQLYRLSDDCFSADVIDLEDKERLDNLPTDFDRNRQFLNVLLHKSEIKYQEFLKCLTGEFDWIKELITGTDINQSPPDPGSNYLDIRRKIFRNYDAVVNDTSIHILSDDLISERIFEINDWERIVSGKTTETKNKQLLDILLRSTTHGYMLLINMLKKDGHSDLVYSINSTSVNENIDKEIEAHLRKEGGLRERSANEILALSLIDQHRDNCTFVTTPSVTKGIEKLAEENILIYVGLAGDGKTKNAVAVMEYFKEKHPDWTFLKIWDITKFDTDVNPAYKTFVLLDDFLDGQVTNTDESICGHQEKYLATIHTYINSGNCKIVMTLRKTVLAKNVDKLEDRKIFNKKWTIDLTSTKFKLKKELKRQILECHFKTSNIVICDRQGDENYKTAKKEADGPILISEKTVGKILDTNSLIGFPQTCYIFCNKRNYTRLGPKYFKKPTKKLIKEITKMVDMEASSCQRVQYSIMVYMLLNGGTMDPDDYDERLFEEVANSVGLKQYRDRDVTDNINKLTDVYINKKGESDIYEFRHQTILESVAICFYDDNGEMLLRHCSRAFIKEFIRPKKFKESKGEIVLKIKEKHYSVVIEQFMRTDISEEGAKRFKWWIGHPLFEQDKFVDKFCLHLQRSEVYRCLMETCISEIYRSVCLFNQKYFATQLRKMFKIPERKPQYSSKKYVRPTQSLSGEESSVIVEAETSKTVSDKTCFTWRSTPNAQTHKFQDAADLQRTCYF